MPDEGHVVLVGRVFACLLALAAVKVPIYFSRQLVSGCPIMAMYLVLQASL